MSKIYREDMERLYDVLSSHDIERYKHIIDEYDLWSVNHDFWNDVYMYGTREEILFWINYEHRGLSIYEIILISDNYEDLFDLALPKIECGRNEMEEAVDYLDSREHLFNFDLSCIDQKTFKRRIQKVKNLIIK